MTESPAPIKHSIFTDVPESRRRNMSAIKGRNTKPELTLRRLLHRMGYRFRLHQRDLPGTPDLVFPSRRTIVFVHGCFWHRHVGCRNAVLPATRREFWDAKLTENVSRDARNIARLEAAGWHTIVIWECAIENDPAGAAGQVRVALEIPP